MADRILVVSDLDGTLLGDEPALEAFDQWLAPRRQQIRLVYNSGRSFDSIRAAVAETALPEPDALIADVGTAMESFEPGQDLGQWPQLNGSWNPELVREVLAPLPGFEPQPDSAQTPHKVSYFVYDATEADLARWKTALEATGLSVNIIYSSDRDLDVLPQGVNKGKATTHLVRHWQIDPGRVIVCGDTGNDLSMFEEGYLGIVVGNALRELKSLDSPRVYHAQGEIAAGVAEGLRHWLTHLEDSSNA